MKAAMASTAVEEAATSSVAVVLECETKALFTSNYLSIKGISGH